MGDKQLKSFLNLLDKLFARKYDCSQNLLEYRENTKLGGKQLKYKKNIFKYYYYYSVNVFYLNIQILNKYFIQIIFIVISIKFIL